MITSIPHFKVIKNRNFCSSAARDGYLDLLKWAKDNGCPWNE